jgi:hypothetical protein
MNEFVINQPFSMSTADDEKNYVTGEQDTLPLQVRAEIMLAEGTYRVIDGELCRIVGGLPPGVNI